MARTKGSGWPIIDIHCHTSHKRPDSANEVVEAARASGIVRAALLGDVYSYGFDPNPEQVSLINDGTAESIRRFPDFFFGMCFLNPANPPDFLDAEIERCVRGYGFRAVKLEVSVRANDARLDPLMRSARARGVPVLQHAWYKNVRDIPGEASPDEVAELATRFPDMTIIMAHLGGHRRRGVLDIQRHGNVVVDTSGSQPVTGIVEYAVDALGADRVVYGSETPGRDFAAQLGRVWGARISESARRKVLYGNARRIFGLTS